MGPAPPGPWVHEKRRTAESIASVNVSADPFRKDLTHRKVLSPTRLRPADGRGPGRSLHRLVYGDPAVLIVGDIKRASPALELGERVEAGRADGDDAVSTGLQAGRARVPAQDGDFADPSRGRWPSALP